MLKEPGVHQHALEMVTLESLVPDDHLLRHIDAFIDFEFIAAICHGLEERGIYGVIGYRRPMHKKGYFYKRDYVYDAEADVYLCPAEQRITYNTTNRKGYREYKSDPTRCKDCLLLMQCTRSANHQKVLTRHVWEHARERLDQHRKTDAGWKIYARRKETVERSFADGKQLHGHRYARLRGLPKVQEQCLLSAACQNMKKIAMHKASKAFLSLIGWLKAAIKPNTRRYRHRSWRVEQRRLNLLAA